MLALQSLLESCVNCKGLPSSAAELLVTIFFLQRQFGSFAYDMDRLNVINICFYRFLNLKEGKLSRHASSELLDERDGSVAASYSRNFDPNAPDFQRVSITGYDDLHIAREVS